MLSRNTGINYSQLYQKLKSAHPTLLSKGEWDAVREFLSVIPWTEENRSDSDNPNINISFQFPKWLPESNLEIAHFLDNIIAKAKAQNRPEIAKLASDKAQEFMKQILIERQLPDSLEGDDEEEEDSDSEAPKPRREKPVYTPAQLTQANDLATTIVNYFRYGSHAFSHQVETLQKIGAGGHGKIYRTRTLSNPTMKTVVKHQLEVSNEQILTEVAIMMACKSPYVMSCIGLQIDETRIKIMMEEATGGSLLTFLKSANLNPTEKTDLLLKIALGLLQIHQMNVIHGDVKPDNVLIFYNTSTREITPKISDFGSAHLITTEDPTFVSNAIRTDLAYCAPEVLIQFSPGRNLAITYTAKVDIYGLALTFFEVYTGQEPLSCEIHHENFRSAQPKKYALDNFTRYQTVDTEVMRNTFGTPTALSEIIELGRARDPHQRPDIKTIVRMLAGAKTEHQKHVRDVNNMFGAPAPRTVAPLSEKEILAAAAEYIGANRDALFGNELTEVSASNVAAEDFRSAPDPKRARAKYNYFHPK